MRTVHVLRAGFEPATAAFGGPCSSDRAVATSGVASSELRVESKGAAFTRNTQLATPSSGPGRIRTCTDLILSQAPLPKLGFWTVPSRFTFHVSRFTPP